MPGMPCPICHAPLVKLSDENMYICKTSGLYFRSDRGQAYPPVGMVRPEKAPMKPKSDFEIFLDEQGIDAKTYKQLDKEMQKSLRFSYLQWSKSRKVGGQTVGPNDWMTKHGLTPELWDWLSKYGVTPVMWDWLAERKITPQIFKDADDSSRKDLINSFYQRNQANPSISLLTQD